MDDTKHIFNVVFRTENQHMTNLSVFNVYPIYWTNIIIPAKGTVTGTIDLFGNAHRMVSGSLTIATSSSVTLIPSMNYSACMVFSGSSIFSASPIENPSEYYT